LYTCAAGREKSEPKTKADNLIESQTKATTNHGVDELLLDLDVRVLLGHLESALAEKAYSVAEAKG
jgi:hypothetical protein